MRMWMVDPKKMCNKHLLGEHVELHMLVGTINRDKKIDGFISRGLLEPSSITKRHTELAQEMTSRGMRHNSTLPNYNLKNHFEAKVDKEKSYKDLLMRCERCQKKKTG